MLNFFFFEVSALSLLFFYFQKKKKHIFFHHYSKYTFIYFKYFTMTHFTKSKHYSHQMSRAQQKHTTIAI